MHRLLYCLMANGAPVQSVVNIDHIDKIRGTILVLNPHLFPEEELKKALAYKEGPVVLIGGKVPSLPDPCFRFQDVYPPARLFCAVYGAKEKIEVRIKKEGRENIPGDMAKINDPPSFIEELYFRKVSDGFLKGCVKAITACAGGIRVLEDCENVRVLAMENKKDKLRIFIANDSHAYARLSLIDVGRKISRIHIVTPFPTIPITPDGSMFRIRVPNRGMVIVDAVLEGS